jgi:hypothetical protein
MATNFVGAPVIRALREVREDCHRLHSEKLKIQNHLNVTDFFYLLRSSKYQVNVEFDVSETKNSAIYRF